MLPLDPIALLSALLRLRDALEDLIDAAEGVPELERDLEARLAAMVGVVADHVERVLAGLGDAREAVQDAAAAVADTWGLGDALDDLRHLLDRDPAAMRARAARAAERGHEGRADRIRTRADRVEARQAARA